MQQKLDIGGVLEQAGEMYAKHWRLLITLSLLVYGVVAVLFAIVAGLFYANIALGVVGAVIAVVVGVIASLLLQGMYIVAADDLRDGTQDMSIAQLIETVRPRLGALFWTGLLAAIGIGIGFVLLAVPGFVLLTWWYVAGAVVMLEGLSGPGALGRSRALVRGNGWRVFALWLITAIIVGIVDRVLGGILGSLSHAAVWHGFSVNIGKVLTGPFEALVPVLAYFQLSGTTLGTGAAQPSSMAAAAAAPSYAPPPPPAGGGSIVPPPGYSGDMPSQGSQHTMPPDTGEATPPPPPAPPSGE